METSRGMGSRGVTSQVINFFLSCTEEAATMPSSMPTRVHFLPAVQCNAANPVPLTAVSCPRLHWNLSITQRQNVANTETWRLEHRDLFNLLLEVVNRQRARSHPGWQTFIWEYLICLLYCGPIKKQFKHKSRDINSVLISLHFPNINRQYKQMTLTYPPVD